MNVLVTGAAGFLGKYIMQLLPKNGISNPIGLDLPGTSEALRCDLSDKEQAEKVLKKKNFDSVIHLAGIRGSYKKMLLVNVNGTANLLNSLNTSPASVVIASSCAVYGIPQTADGCIKENHPTNPITDYGKTMLEKELTAQKICSLKSINLASARIFNLFGAEQLPSMMTSAVAQKLVKIYLNKTLPPLKTGPLHTIRDLIDVEDVAQAMIEMALNKTNGIFNVGTGIPHSGTEVVDTFQNILNTKIPVEISSEFNPMVEQIYANNSKIISSLGWKATVPFDFTLKTIIKYWLKREQE